MWKLIQNKGCKKSNQGVLTKNPKIGLKNKNVI